jgi:hypothetical protein
MALMGRDLPSKGGLSFKNDVKATALTLHKKDEGVVVRFFYFLPDVGYVLHRMPVHFQDNVASLDRGVVCGTARLHVCHDHARPALGP